MEVYFTELNQLYFDGYDIGKLVEDAWGDSDYEYTYTVEPIEVEKLFTIFKLYKGDRSGLLLEIQKQFSGNEAYSSFGAFMNKHHIKYSSSTWT